MATTFRTIGAASADAHYRYQVPCLEAVPEGSGNGKRTRLQNLDDVADALQVLPQTLGRFLSIELAAQVSCAADKSEIRGHLKGAALDKAVCRFEEVYVVCRDQDCQKPELNVRTSDRGSLAAKCRACGWRGELDEKFKYDKVTKQLSKHLSKSKTKWCGNLRGDPPIKLEVPGFLAAPEAESTRAKARGKKGKDTPGGDPTERKESKATRLAAVDQVCAAGDDEDVCSLPDETSQEALEERHAAELAELEAKMEAHLESVKGVAGKGKKGKEKVEAAEREVESWNYALWSKQQREIERLAEHLSRLRDERSG